MSAPVMSHSSGSLIQARTRGMGEVVTVVEDGLPLNVQLDQRWEAFCKVHSELLAACLMAWSTSPRLSKEDTAELIQFLKNSRTTLAERFGAEASACADGLVASARLVVQAADWVDAQACNFSVKLSIALWVHGEDAMRARFIPAGALPAALALLPMFDNGGNEQPTTCSQCGSRTNFDEVAGHPTLTHHICLNSDCRFEFLLEDDPSDAEDDVDADDED